MFKNQTIKHKRTGIMTRKQWASFRMGRKNDNRLKLTDSQREEIRHRYRKGDIGMRPLARKYGVNRTTIRNVVKPERYKAQLERNKQEKVWLRYYDTDRNKHYMRVHRNNIRKVLKGGE